MGKKLKGALCVIVAILICAAAVYRTGLLPASDSPLTEPDASITGYYYLRLDETSRDAYRCVIAVIHEHPERIQVPALTNEQLDAVFTALSYDNPEMLCQGLGCRLVSVGFRCYYIPQYSKERAQCDLCTASLENAANLICEGIPAGASDYEKELYIHDTLAADCVYSEFGDDVGTAYGALVGDVASCEGYARAMQLLLLKAGVQSHLVTGQAVNEEGVSGGHMWNRVQLDGEWYNVDVTWDDHDDSTLPRHAYFNVSDAMLSRSHSDFNLPWEVCGAVAMNYHVLNNLYFTAADSSLEARYKSLVRTAYTRGEPYLEIRFSDSQVLSEAQTLLVDGSYAGECLAAIKGYDSSGQFQYRYTVDDDSNSFILYF